MGFFCICCFAAHKNCALNGTVHLLKRSSKCFVEIKILTAFQHTLCLLMEKLHEGTLLKVFMNNCFNYYCNNLYYYVLKVMNTAQFRDPG